MIDVWLVASNSLWIAGLSLLLATISWASWVASVDEAQMRAILARPGARRAWGLGAVLFCAGMAATGRAWWEWALWGALAVTFLVHSLGAGKAKIPDRKRKSS